MAYRTRYALCLSLFAPLAACASDGADENAVDAQDATATFELPRQGADDTFDVANWNVEWFMLQGQGPSDEELQLANVSSAIRQADLDLWGLSELVRKAEFDRLVASLPDYDGLLVTDPRVEGGEDYNASQKVGLIFKRDVVSVQSARVLFAPQDDLFAGRPPLEASLRVKVGADSVDLTVVVVHLKANTGPAQQVWDMRRQSLELLKSHLDAEHPGDPVLVIGDFNDDTDKSTAKGFPTPFAPFLAEPGNYTFLTKSLSDRQESSTVSFREFIDHQLATNEAASLFVPDSARVVRLDSVVPDYGKTTSDHFPVMSRLALGNRPPPPPPPPTGGKPLINEVLANEPGAAQAGEFVEIVNAGEGTADLGGFTLSDGTSVRHVFGTGTTLGPGERLAVFGNADGIAPGAGRSVASSTGGLSLNNTGDALTLRDASGATVDSFTYAASLASEDGVSMNRSPDADPSGSFVLHNTIASEPASPGR